MNATEAKRNMIDSWRKAFLPDDHRIKQEIIKKTGRLFWIKKWPETIDHGTIGEHFAEILKDIEVASKKGQLYYVYSIPDFMYDNYPLFINILFRFAERGYKIVLLPASNKMIKIEYT